MDVSTIIVSYNTFALTRDAVRTALTAAPGLRQEVIVVDNDSPDDSGRRLQQAFADDDRVTVLVTGENAGFAAANNRGAAVADGRVLYFLNPDTVSHADATARLAAYLDARPDAGAVGPRVLNDDGTDQPSTSSFVGVGDLARHYLPFLGARRPGPEGGAQTVDVVKGCALAVRRDAFDAVGGWDERTFLYAEEDELCWALAEAGYVNVYLPDAVVTHLGGAATSADFERHQVLAYQGSAAFLRRHAPRHVVGLNRALGVIGFGFRSAAFPLLARLRPSDADDYKRRGDAARALCRWFVRDYA